MDTPRPDIILIHGAPGVGKSSVAQALQQRLQCPCFEFGWIPEFRRTRLGEISYEEEEAFSFENLLLVTRNYLRRGFAPVILTDLRDPLVQQAPSRLRGRTWVLVTLWVDDDAVLERRVLDETRSSGYRDWQEALDLNHIITRRPPRRNEVRINTTHLTVPAVVEALLAALPG
jgi:chloramphenicol 3-O-phosphotransferase